MTFVSALVLMLLVMDPLGNIPLSLGVLQNVPHHRRRRIVIREMFIALAVLVGAMFVGPYVMSVLHLENIVLQLAGGIVLFLIAIHMIFPGETTLTPPEEAEPLIVPLAIPLVAGPSAVATILLLSSQYPHNQMEVLLALLTAWGVTAATLTMAVPLSGILGKRGLRAVERLMGMVLIMVATQMFISGLRTFLLNLDTLKQLKPV
ncbi:MAG: antibiotic transporter [Planctomycetia bacterium]|nr:antibiotic transporter [Planctomycetia bacterium]